MNVVARFTSGASVAGHRLSQWMLRKAVVHD
jgi:hypothetical protein